MGAGVDVPLKERKLAERLERDGHNVLLRSVAGCEEQGYEIRRTLALDRQLAALVREPSTSIASRSCSPATATAPSAPLLARPAITSLMRSRRNKRHQPRINDKLTARSLA
jgi:hypothetical protein